MFGAVSCCHHWLGLVDCRQDVGQWLTMDALVGRVEQSTDVHVGAVPDPVLVGKDAVCDYAGRLEFSERLVDLVVGEGEHRT